MSQHHGGDPAAVSQTTRTKLMVLLPLTMALLVGATGFYTISMAERFFVLRPPAEIATRGLAGELGLQIAAISIVAALIGLSLAIGIARPVDRMARRLDAIASGDLRGSLDIRSVSELDSLAGAFNAAVDAVNRYVFHGLTGAVLTTNADGLIIGVSPAAEGILGQREDALVGRPLRDILNPAPGSRAALAAIDEAFRSRRPVALEEVELVVQDGRTIKLGISSSYMRRDDAEADDPGADIVGVLLTSKDMVEIRRLREQLRQADHLVALGTVTAGVAHELRNPLASIRGLAELLGRDFAAADPRTRFVSTMLEAIDRLNRLIEDLLLFSSPAPAVTHDVDLAALVREIATFAGHGAPDREVRVFVADSAQPARVTGHRDRLTQVFMNVLSNAVQATPAGGVVTARIAATDALVSVRIHNTGSYIAPEVRTQLFVPFFTTKASGSGLGLPIARQFVISAGGRIDIDSDPVEGTTFTIELPRSSGEAGGYGGNGSTRRNGVNGDGTENTLKFNASSPFVSPLTPFLRVNPLAPSPPLPPRARN
jgi:PAS domain S-box-containing protein